MNYIHLTIEERTCIYQLWLSGVSIRQISKAVKRSPSTISRELKRNECGYRYKYLPHIAQKKYEKRRIKCHRPVKICPFIKKYIEDKLNQQWSPEQIAKRKNGQPENSPCFSTIYRWIHKKYLIRGEIWRLRRKGKFKRPAETRGRFNIGKTIKKRPKEVYKRHTLGHWEADTVESGRVNFQRKSKYCFVTLAERKSRLYLVKLLPDRTSENVTAAIIELLSQFPPELVKTITCDRGKEFAKYKDIEESLNCQMYFTDPYCAWQKGTNENSNGLLREYYPKGMDLSQTNDVEVLNVLTRLNNRPRKCINFKTPLEVINESYDALHLN
ncbi:IS30 family transposase [Mariniplasma anaerobium]|uniref:IS30 family transposase n=1 Tax=Mariniplasma anaerobium TaxID=2735436 RepID=A0A7U9TJE7_9MOLU|nr:IS30 family transposase [Mariniplasma anaerobium]BCR35456.1 IS30 family transposase [Mariniplasma anaerobium]BCR36432.1 IS30 family transposase [Mariniplasma anaerobium]